MNDFKKIIDDFLAKVKDNPGTIFGLLYPYILVVIVIVGLYYTANIGTVAINSVPAYVPDTTVQQTLQLKEARTVPPVDIFELSNPTDELIQKGKELYSANCASCHNETGMGGGPAAVGLNPAPRNLTSPDGWINGRTLTGIYTTLEEGIEGSAMISYNFLTPRERLSIAHYMRTEFMQDPPKNTDDELAALNQTYSLSQGMKVPAQIPLDAALEIVLNESSVKNQKLETALSNIESNQNNQSTKLFNYLTDNKKLALSSLINSDIWKKSENSFTEFLTLNINQNGFNGRVFNLSESERNLLYNYFKQIL